MILTTMINSEAEAHQEWPNVPGFDPFFFGPFSFVPSPQSSWRFVHHYAGSPIYSITRSPIGRFLLWTLAGPALTLPRGRVRSHESGPACGAWAPIENAVSPPRCPHQPNCGLSSTPNRSPLSTAQETHQSSSPSPPTEECQLLSFGPPASAATRSCSTSCRRQLIPWTGRSRAGSPSVITISGRIRPLHYIPSVYYQSLDGLFLSLPTPSDAAPKCCAAGIIHFCGGQPNGRNTPEHLPKPNSDLQTESIYRKGS